MINLLNYRKIKYSTIGNDGIIEFIFKSLNVKNGIFVEIGAWDGIKNSNCRKLFDEGWKGFFIESDFNKYQDLRKNYKGDNQITCINKNISSNKENLFDNIIDKYLENKNIDFCSIDIDGLDIEVFETFKKYLPTVICIEGGQMLHPFYKRVKRDIEKQNIQQSLKIMIESFEKKGYKILCSYQDSFFVKKESYNLFNVSSDLLTLYFNGLRAIPGRMPFIQKYIKKVGLKNEIIDYILKKTDYKRYGWERRREWAVKEIDIINKLINKIERKEIMKYNI